MPPNELSASGVIVLKKRINNVGHAANENATPSHARHPARPDYVYGEAVTSNGASHLE